MQWVWIGFGLTPPAGKSVESSRRLRGPAEYPCGEWRGRHRNRLTTLEGRAISSAPPPDPRGPSARACCPNRYQPAATRAWNPKSARSPQRQGDTRLSARRAVHRPRLERTDPAASRLRLRAGVPGAPSAARLCRLMERERKRQESNLPKTPTRPPTGLKPARPTGSGTLPGIDLARFFGIVNPPVWAVCQIDPSSLPKFRSCGVRFDPSAPSASKQAVRTELGE
jgi:hypothetical protein